jgi:allantoate deiminase
MRRANAHVGGWMRRAGLAVREDRVGNLLGRQPGARPGARTLVLGSHLDTVRDAGRFDGSLGVLLPLSALEALRAEGVELPFAVEVVGFSEEEGVRFSSAYLGSKGFTGALRRSDLALRDEAGISVADALAAHNGRRLPPPAPAHARGSLLGYLEVHIEQGPVLEARGLAAGVVSAIAGQTRAAVVFTGRAGHAGTTPMDLRRDALAGAAEFVLAAERLARARPPLVATVGRAAVRPGAANVIPASAELSLDVRHPRDPARRAALRRIRSAGRRIAARRGLRFSFTVLQENGAVACSRELTALLARSVRACQGASPALASGAGHDAVVLAGAAPVAMLFVRCRGGLSHHPDEHVGRRDLEAALRIVVDFLKRLAARHEP